MNKRYLLKHPGFRFFLFFLAIFPICTDAQYFVAGQDPASIRWRQIDTPNFQIIYPSNYEPQAQRVAHVFEKVYEYSGNTLQHSPKKISVIMHTKATKSNGFVAWSPSRVELFPIPSQNSYAQDWIEQLAIHELRHHVQIDKIESEIPLIFNILLGEQAAALVVGAYLPFWFLEGDAVVTETALSRSGRGRLPSFSMELKAQVDEKRIFSFDKAYLGSYKDYIPDYYQIGYQIVSNIRNQNGGEVWGKILHHIARNPLGVNSLSRGLKLTTGKNQDGHYRSIMQNLKSTHPFSLGVQEDTGRIAQLLVKPSKSYTAYHYPYFVNNHTFVALKTSLDQVPCFVLVGQDKNEQKLFTPGLILDESVSFSNGKLIWFESLPDPRWAHRESSLLRIFDIKTKTLREKRYRENLSAPVISPDGKIVAAVKFDDRNHCSIALISIEDGKIAKELKAGSNQMYFTPSWSQDQTELFAVLLSDNQKSLISINLKNNEIQQLTKPTPGELRKPVQQSEFVYFTGNLSGKDEGYALDRITKRICRILPAKYGLKDLQPDTEGREFIYSDYTSNGFKIVKKEVPGESWKAYDLSNRFQDTLSNHLTTQEKGIIDFSALDTTAFRSSKYSKWRNLINIHSWSPLYVDPDQTAIDAGFSIVSQNKLTTAISQFGYDYSPIDRAGKWIGKFEYAGWYPIISLDGDYGRENSSYYQINRYYKQNQLIKQDTVAVPYTQKVMNLHLDISLPLNLTHGKMYRMIAPEVQIGYSHHWQEPTTPVSVYRGSYIPFTYRLYLHNLRSQSIRDIQTRWGQKLDIHFRNTPFGDRRLGSIFSAETSLYFPGLLANHGLKFYGGYQNKISDKSFFNDIILYPRGYSHVENNRLLTLRSDYVLPLLLPDWHLWHFYYLKRISLRLHYDFSRIDQPIHQTNSIITTNLSSTGAEISTDCHFLRFIAPIKMGVRYSYLIEPGKFVSEFIFSANLKGW